MFVVYFRNPLVARPSNPRGMISPVCQMTSRATDAAATMPMAFNVEDVWWSMDDV